MNGYLFKESKSATIKLLPPTKMKSSGAASASAALYALPTSEKTFPFNPYPEANSSTFSAGSALFTLACVK